MGCDTHRLQRIWENHLTSRAGRRLFALGRVRVDCRIDFILHRPRTWHGPEATGWSNIIFRCAFMGLSYREAKRLSPAIAEFSGLGDYLDLPTRTYSSGMFLRLAFAISTSIKPDILIMDEMIAAGDVQFIEKAQRRLHELVDKTDILALASHDLAIIEKICNKVLWLDHGVVKQSGPPNVVLKRYKSLQTEATS
jgi:ABC-type polysaccharide/polyol phosphate transport system ATPase subunit